MRLIRNTSAGYGPGRGTTAYTIWRLHVARHEDMFTVQWYVQYPRRSPGLILYRKRDLWPPPPPPKSRFVWSQYDLGSMV